MINTADNEYMAKQKTMSFQIDPEIRSVLDEQAEIQDRSISWLINFYLRKALEKDGLMQPKEKPKKK
jgi:predicted transcriptional regulator